nr:DUF3153 domain-containing protein [Gordonia soli]
MLSASFFLTGCLERSTTVGDRFSGSIIVATSPDNPRGAPRLDVPESMSSRVTLSDYRVGPGDGDSTSGSPSSTAESEAPSAGESGAPTSGADDAQGSSDDQDAEEPARIGTRASFTDLTAGQFSQLGDIVAGAFGDSSMSMDLTAKRSGDVVRFRGTADLTELVPGRDYVQFSVVFDGPVSATNGDQTGEYAVTWTPEPRKPSDFSADSTYADPATAAVGSWTWLLAIICVVVIAVIVRLAYVSRYRGPRPGRPRDGGRSTPSKRDPVSR